MIFAATIVLPNPVAAASTPVSCSSSAVTAVSCSFVNVPRKRASMPYPASVHLASASPHSGHPPTPRYAADNRVVRRCGGKAIQRMRQFVESRTSKAASAWLAHSVECRILKGSEPDDSIDEPGGKSFTRDIY